MIVFHCFIWFCIDIIFFFLLGVPCKFAHSWRHKVWWTKVNKLLYVRMGENYIIIHDVNMQKLIIHSEFNYIK